MYAAIVPVIPEVQLKKVMVATDFSPSSAAAVHMAQLLARHYGSEVIIANIWTIPALAETNPEAVGPGSVLAQEAAQAQLQNLASSDLLKDLKVKSILRFGDPISEIGSLVDAEKIDLLLLGTHGGGKVSRAFLGSVAESLIRDVPCPVLTMGPSLQQRFLEENRLADVLVPTDLSAHSLAVIPYLTAVTAEFHSNVHFLHVMSEEPAEGLPAITKVQEKMERHCGCHFSPRTMTSCGVEFGDVATQVLAAAHLRHSDLIAMGVRPGGRFVTHLKANVGYQIIANAPCPVLTVKHA